MKVRHSDKLKLRVVNKDCILRPLAGKVSRVITMRDCIVMVNKMGFTQLPFPSEASTVGGKTIPNVLPESGTLSNPMCTWKDALEIVSAAGGTVNLDLGKEAGGGITMTTNEIVNKPTNKEGYQTNSETMTKTELEYVLDNTTFA
jgi:hypothetical protein